MSETDDLVEALGSVVAAFNNLKIPHYIGGSIASSYHGATRSTMDVDLVCEMQESQVVGFLAGIDDRFYVSKSAVRQAVVRMSCFNLIHLPTACGIWVRIVGVLTLVAQNKEMGVIR